MRCCIIQEKAAAEQLQLQAARKPKRQFRRCISANFFTWIMARASGSVRVTLSSCNQDMRGDEHKISKRCVATHTGVVQACSLQSTRRPERCDPTPNNTKVMLWYPYISKSLELYCLLYLSLLHPHTSVTTLRPCVASAISRLEIAVMYDHAQLPPVHR